MELHVAKTFNGALLLDVRELSFLPLQDVSLESHWPGQSNLHAEIELTKLTVTELEKPMAEYPQYRPNNYGSLLKDTDLLDAVYRLLQLDETVTQLRKENEVLRAELAHKKAIDNGLKPRIENRIVKARKLLDRLTKANDYTAMAVVSVRLRELESLL
ncbi:hypothetical protein GCM10022252_20050 [Streptosporangium oxazolinicum]|uniref:Uncharacterized protein n=1 Tax=Streptosporangium oxazolinicum TaxID=909287 RepID=A0ABP8AP46_9ACTN